MPSLAYARLDAFAKDAVASIQQAIRTKRPTPFGVMNTTGRTADSLRYEVVEHEEGLTLFILGVDYSLALEYGRRPGKFPSLTKIQEWVEAKGLGANEGKLAVAGPKGYSSLAYLIARKITEKGTVLYQQGQPSGIFGDVISGPALENLEKRLMPALVKRVVNAIALVAA